MLDADAHIAGGRLALDHLLKRAAVTERFFIDF
jgi:hypothetical protein